MSNKTFSGSAAGAGGSSANKPSGAAAAVTSTPIAIASKSGAKDDAADSKKPPRGQMAFSMPNMTRPPPPKAPTQRPRVPSCDPPPMALPPSPLPEVPIVLSSPPTAAGAGGASTTSAPMAVGPSNAEKNKPPKEKRTITISRSLTIYSSSAPHVSFLQNPALFHPSFAPLAEGKDKPAGAPAGAAGPNSATSVNSTASSTESTAANSPTPGPGGAAVAGAAALGAGPRRKSGLAKEDELLAAVGSPTVFSMLRLDADIRRKNSITDGKAPLLGTSLKKTLSPAAALTADGKKKLSESKTQKEIDAAKAAAASKGAGGSSAGAGAGAVSASAAAQTANANEDDSGAAGTEPDDLQFPIDDGENDDAGDGMAPADSVLDDDEAVDPNKPAVRDQYSTLFS